MRAWTTSPSASAMRGCCCQSLPDVTGSQLGRQGGTPPFLGACGVSPATTTAAAAATTAVDFYGSTKAPPICHSAAVLAHDSYTLSLPVSPWRAPQQQPTVHSSPPWSALPEQQGLCARLGEGSEATFSRRRMSFISCRVWHVRVSPRDGLLRIERAHVLSWS